jgi:hypothetical protein
LENAAMNTKVGPDLEEGERIRRVPSVRDDVDDSKDRERKRRLEQNRNYSYQQSAKARIGRGKNQPVYVWQYCSPRIERTLLRTASSRPQMSEVVMMFKLIVIQKYGTPKETESPAKKLAPGMALS